MLFQAALTKVETNIVLSKAQYQTEVRVVFVHDQ